MERFLYDNMINSYRHVSDIKIIVENGFKFGVPNEAVLLSIIDMQLKSIQNLKSDLSVTKAMSSDRK